MIRLLSAFAALSLSATSHAGTVLEMVNRDLSDKSETVSRTFAQDGRMRIESGEANDNYVVFKDDALYTVDQRQKSYMVMDRATMKSIAAKLNPAMQQIQQMLESMSPEQRAQMEKMVGNRLPTSSKAPVEEVRKTSRTGTAAGHACTYSELYVDNVLDSEFCVVPTAKLEGSKELYDAALKVSTLMKDIVKDMNAPFLRQMIDRQTQNFADLGGIPVMTRTFREGKPAHESTMKAVRSEAVPASAFEMPPGFTRKELPSM